MWSMDMQQETAPSSPKYHISLSLGKRKATSRASACQGTAFPGADDALAVTHNEEAARSHAQKLKQAACLHAEQGESALALKEFEQAIFFTPSDATLHEMRAQVLNDTGKCFEAVMAAKAAVDLRPTWPDAWVTLGRCEANLGEPELALGSFDKALQLGADCSSIAEERATLQGLVARRQADPASAGTRVRIVHPS